MAQMVQESVHHDLHEELGRYLQEDIAVPVGCMRVLVSCMRKSTANTFQELELHLRGAVRQLKACPPILLSGRTHLSLSSGCDLFMKYVTRAFLEYEDFAACKQELLRRGEKFAGMSMSSRSSIAKIGHNFVRDGGTVMTHGDSRVVKELLLMAAKTKTFNVMVLDTHPSAPVNAAAYAEANIPTSLIKATDMAGAIENTDMIIVGAELVTENGGIVNSLGSYQAAMIAKVLKKPFYVACESYKFARVYPLRQRDITDLCPVCVCPVETSSKVKYSHNTIDFTPSEYINLLFTDLGVLTPAAVSDELIKLYH